MLWGWLIRTIVVVLHPRRDQLWLRSWCIFRYPDTDADLSPAYAKRVEATVDASQQF